MMFHAPLGPSPYLDLRHLTGTFGLNVSRLLALVAQPLVGAFSGAIPAQMA